MKGWRKSLFTEDPLKPLKNLKGMSLLKIFGVDFCSEGFRDLSEVCLLWGRVGGLSYTSWCTEASFGSALRNHSYWVQKILWDAGDLTGVSHVQYELLLLQFYPSVKFLIKEVMPQTCCL